MSNEEQTHDEAPSAEPTFAEVMQAQREAWARAAEAKAETASAVASPEKIAINKIKRSAK